MFTCGLECVVFRSGLCSRWRRFNRSTSLVTAQIHCYYDCHYSHYSLFLTWRRERCAISQREDRLDSICIFLVWKACVWVCVRTVCVSAKEPGSQSTGRLCAICYMWSLRFYAGCCSLLNWRSSCLTDTHFVFSCLSLCLCLSHTHTVTNVYVQLGDYPAGSALLFCVMLFNSNKASMSNYTKSPLVFFDFLLQL